MVNRTGVGLHFGNIPEECIVNYSGKRTAGTNVSNTLAR
jgi:hypothetical protein